MQHSLKVENTPTHHRSEYNVLGTIQTSFLDTFKATTNKHDQERNPPQCSKDIMCIVIYYEIEIKSYNIY